MKTGLKSIAAAAIAAFTFGFAPSAMASDPNEEGVQLWENGPYFATTNLGADSPTDYGYFFQWGSTTGHKMLDSTFTSQGGPPRYLVNSWSPSSGAQISDPFISDNCQTWNKKPADLFEEGIIDSTAGNLTARYDPATQIMGDPWRMPTAAEIQELQAKIANGTVVKSYGDQGPSGGTLTLKGTGAYADKEIKLRTIYYADSNQTPDVVSAITPGAFWTSTVEPGEFKTTTSFCLKFDGSGFSTTAINRWWGLPVRAVRTKPLDTSVEVRPNAAANTTLGGVYTNNVPVVKTGEKYLVKKNAIVDVVFNANTGYYFLDGSELVTAMTIRVTAETSLNVVDGPTPFQIVEVQPKPATNTTLDGVYVDGKEITPIGTQHFVPKDATVDVVFNADDTYYFQDGSGYVKVATNTVTATSDPTVVQGPTPDRVVKVQPEAKTNSTLGGVYVGGTQILPISDKYWVAWNATVDVLFNANTGYYFNDSGTYVTSMTISEIALSDPTEVQGPEAIQLYTVRIESVQRGTVTSDKYVAAEGDTVTLTATPDWDCEVATIAIVGDKTHAVFYPTQGAKVDEYTFTMPSEGVFAHPGFNKIGKETLPLTDPSGNPISVTLSYTWVKNLTGKTKASEQAAALNVKQDNQQMLWQNAILGLTGSDPTSIPVIAPIQLSDPGKVGFRLSGVNVDMTSGASVSNRVWRGSTPGGHDLGSSDIYSYEQSIDAPVPSSGVWYYNLEVLIK